ncbi:hypothetical protein Tco_0367828 [Tanacetum coccineum]
MFIRTSSSLAESLKNYVEELKQGRGQTRQQGHTSEWVSWGKRVGCYRLLLLGCECEDVEARIGSFDMGNDCLIRLSWAHVHSKCLEDVQLTITMFEGTSIERNIDVLTQVCCEAALRKEFKDWMLACEAILKSQLE